MGAFHSIQLAKFQYLKCNKSNLSRKRSFKCFPCNKPLHKENIAFISQCFTFLFLLPNSILRACCCHCCSCLREGWIRLSKLAAPLPVPCPDQSPFYSDTKSNKLTCPMSCLSRKILPPGQTQQQDIDLKDAAHH